MNRHTHGPYELQGEGAIVAQLGSKRTGVFLITAPLTSALEPIPAETVEANAHLLTASWQMLKALQDTLDYWTTTGFATCDPGCNCIVEDVKAAIAAAKGGAL